MRYLVSHTFLKVSYPSLVFFLLHKERGKERSSPILHVPLIVDDHNDDEEYKVQEAKAEVRVVLHDVDDHVLSSVKNFEQVGSSSNFLISSTERRSSLQPINRGKRIIAESLYTFGKNCFSSCQSFAGFQK